ncbi:MAG: hypothetical protein LBR27_07715 [Bifidobacteriaceae bacterium]|jgi:predicted metal-dependent HD superfamily phosphohydrolase|nr:hypothetical protein [Bifidobacteriaceae bacterium]
MGVITAPEWLLAVWSRSLIEIGSPAPVGEIERIGDQLLDRWCNPARRFHGVGHLIMALERINELAQEAGSPPLVRLAAYYHGAVMTTDIDSFDAHTWGEDEAASADFAAGQLTHLQVAEAKVERIRWLIASLGRRPAVIKDPDLAVLCDAERAVLATDPQTYRAYVAGALAEYAHLPEEVVLKQRVVVLRRWLAKDRLFLTSVAELWEDVARNNVEAELTRTLRRLEDMGVSLEEPAEPESPEAAVPDGAPSPDAPVDEEEIDESYWDSVLPGGGEDVELS